ncbi:MAG: DUF2127 domain-containing protein [Patescibacteria group bacterium]|nr:DUF2127 domain-containing protein [Patescibacteria group bacterium]
MPSIKKLFEEKNIHLLFELSLIGKGIIALFEIIGGILVYFISQQFLMNLVLAITQDELTEDPKDFIAHYLIQSAQNFSISSQHFAAFFLFSHGIIKMFLIIGLLREKRWYYPTAMVIFGLFIVYQLYRFSFTHSLWLLLITFLDILVIWLTWHEYRYVRNK